MSGISPSPSPAEQASSAERHLGDRLAALVDGELGHDARERVLAHLATCSKCKAEADAQRRLKTMFVESAPPPLSAGLLARLQGLPGGSPDGPSGPSGPFGPPPGADPFSSFAYAPPAAAGGPQGGFPIHKMGGQEAGRSRRRFAFVAAGAVSLAAIALGGSLPMDAVEPNTRGDAPAARTGPVVSVFDAVARENRIPRPGTVPTLRPEPPLASTSPTATPASARPVSLSR
ncbi:zf-HC2 domain-containing protein [Streptomyces sp. NBC_00503]|uniref:zf-HC2 domain-containing protein n=1 Tax=Streptomyces sp. NBC_00503 TaxID=2903659 RepID=UPI002E81B12C|nr:zf-HC2 domain-containing protein [Streptomyces sp. NBC_00503]WUD83438.1 zf-HC2 domain-containing protein [Streptomyces sp. NBC_00503]